jgi:hypothetical protein
MKEKCLNMWKSRADHGRAVAVIPILNSLKTWWSSVIQQHHNNTLKHEDMARTNVSFYI